MPHASSPELLVLHGVRVKGMADGAAVASRFGLDHHVVEELLLDYEAQGLVTRARFAGIGGWALTAAGRAENERRLAAELEETTARTRDRGRPRRVPDPQFALPHRRHELADPPRAGRPPGRERPYRLALGRARP